MQACMNHQLFLFYFSNLDYKTTRTQITKTDDILVK